LRLAVVFPIVLLLFGGVALLLPVVQKRVRERTTRGAAVRTAKEVWDHGSDEQRRAIPDFIDVMQGPHRDSLLAKVWDDLPEPLRTSVTENFRRSGWAHGRAFRSLAAGPPPFADSPLTDGAILLGTCVRFSD